MNDTTNNRSEYEAIANTVQQYINGGKSGRGDEMKTAFHAEATVERDLVFMSVTHGKFSIGTSVVRGGHRLHCPGADGNDGRDTGQAYLCQNLSTIHGTCGHHLVSLNANVHAIHGQLMV